MALQKASAESSAGDPPGKTACRAACEALSGLFDEGHGGFGGAPKFPSPHHFLFLLRYWKRTGEPKALEMVEKSLSAMRRGGVYDQLGFGFHRYSTDARWRLPHFEKMLYDQAMLSLAFLECFQATGKKIYSGTAGEIFTYVLRDLKAPGGGFFCAEDADSEGEEGRFYLWTRGDLDRALGPEDAEIAAMAFGVVEAGRGSGAVDPDSGFHVLHGGRLPDWPAGRTGDSQTIEARIGSIRRRLLLARDERPRPFKDTKVLADWNGLMIAALAAVYRVTNEKRYLRAAAAAADFVLDKMRDAEGRLFHVLTGEEARVPAFLNDHAFLVKGLVALYEAGYEPRYLEKALELVDRAIGLFWDKDEGGFVFSADGEEGARRKDLYDGAVPSGNSGTIAW